jgi:hypothetical protein
MPFTVAAPLLLGLVAALYIAMAIRAAYRVRGKHVVICPETGAAAGVVVDAGHAAATALLDSSDVRLTSCSRWPDRQGCDQPCVTQIERAPARTRAKAIATRYFLGKRCAICHRAIDAPNAATLQPGFIAIESHAVNAWDEIPPQSLLDATEHQLPLCANCTLAESFRQRFPDKVTDRPVRPLATSPR